MIFILFNILLFIIWRVILNSGSEETRMSKAMETRKRNQESKARLEGIRAATLQVVRGGICPDCGKGLKLNLSLAGWWQCEQFGAEGFRKDSSKPACSWQGFTE